MMRAALKLFSCYVPNEFTKILDDIKNNIITHLKIDDELFDKFGGWYERDNVFPKQLIPLGHAIEKNTSILSIELKGYMFPKGFCHLVDALKINNTVQELAINMSEAWSENDPSARGALASMLTINKGLKKLTIMLSSISDNKYVLSLVKALKINKTLEVLELNRPHILYPESLYKLSQLPKFNNTLKKISLYSHERLLKPGDNPFKEFINPSWNLQEVKDIMRNKNSNTFFKYLPKEVISKIEEYVAYGAEKLFPRFK